MIYNLDEAIKHEEKIAEAEEQNAKLHQRPDRSVKGSGKRYLSCLERAKEHRQLAEWLKELKMWRAYGRRNKDKLPEDMQLLKALNEEVNADE